MYHYQPHSLYHHQFIPFTPNALPVANRTHNNEQKLTRTILLVNACLLTTWLPDCIIGTFLFLVASQTITASDDTFALIQTLRSYSSFGFFLNGSLNGLIYLVRINRIRNLYKPKLSHLFRRGKVQTENQKEGTELEGSSSLD